MEYRELLRITSASLKNMNAPLRIISDMGVVAEWERKEREYLARRSYPSEWARIGIVLDDPYVIGVRDLVRFPDGKLRGYIRIIDRASLKNGQSVAILLFSEVSGKFALLRHFRHATRSWHLEIPRGFGEINTPPLKQAKRELWEELQVQVNYIVSLGSFHANTGLESTETQLFFAKSNSECVPNRNEGISEVVGLTLSQIEHYIESGQITDSFTIASYTRAKLRGLL